MKKYYFINKFDTNNIDKQDKQTAIIYRNYSSKPIDQTLILKIKKYCKKKSIKFYLSNNINRCEELINQIVDIDFKSWLLTIDIYNDNDKDLQNQVWFTKGISKFKDFDLRLEVDRFHLNNILFLQEK